MEAQKLLDNAIYYERRKNWRKAILSYDDLLKIFKEDAFKKLCLAAEEEMKILQFQCYFHSASAHQKLTEHDKAIILFEKAIKTLQKTKNDCRVGCITGKNLHWCVPAYARKALSEIHLDRLKDALKSSESALVLDVSNPDIFCIRALVRFLLGDKEKATSDVTQANKMNSSHLCSLLLRIWFEKHNSNSEERHRKREWSKDEEKAYEINPSVVAYFECTDIKERFMEMFDRYLPTIRCCHTLTVYDILQVSQARSEAKDKTVRKGKAAVSTTGELARSRTKTVIQNEKQIQCSLNTKESDIECNLGTTTGLKATTKELSSTEQVSENDCHKEKSSKIDINENRKNPSSLAAQNECCKECSSVEEFLKHLISTTKDTSLAKRSNTEGRTEGLALDLEDREPVRMYPRPWLRNQEFTTLSPNFSTRHLKPP